MSKKKKRGKPNVRERSPEPTPESTPTLVSEAEVEAMARRLYYEVEDGEDIDLMIESGQYTGRAYLSQIKAAEEGGEGWGPPVSPYEDRMTRSLQLKLIREKQRLMEKCRQRVRDELEAIAAEQITTQPVRSNSPQAAKAGVKTPLRFETEIVNEAAGVAERAETQTVEDRLAVV